ncbi:MAG: cold shock domain-containing protein [bacterium]|nr:cold shock domain-containing protein [bacterium]MCP5067773.1 cold shock domain-containing protein [bacterium]
MLSLDEIEAGAQCTHKNTGLRYAVVAVEDEEVLLEAQTDGHEPLTVPADLFVKEFHVGEQYRTPRRGRSRGRSRRTGPQAPAAPTGPKSKGKIKKMVRDRGFGFIRGEDGKEVFFHRSGMNGTEYDNISEGDTVEYVIQEGPRGARAEHVRGVTAETAA